MLPGVKSKFLDIVIGSFVSLEFFKPPDKRSYDDVRELALGAWKHNQTAGLTALAAKATAKIKRWLADTGCGYDLISRSDVHKRHIQKANEDEVITLSLIHI